MTDRPSPAMESLREKLSNGQLISVPHKDTIRLLEVYVQRSLSVNDGTLSDRDDRRKEKWVTKRIRRHSSDPSIYQEEGKKGGEEDDSEEDDSEEDHNEPEAFLPPVEPLPEEPERTREKKEKKKRSKKSKKSSLWKTFVGFLSRKSSKDKDSGTDTSSEEEGTPEPPVTCLPIVPLSPQKKKNNIVRRKTVRRRFSTKRLSLIRSFRQSRELTPADISDFEAVVSVEPTLSYYEKVSEEMEKIVHEVKDKEEDKPLTDEEVINRIIELTKEEGDAIEDKLKDNPALNNFFQGLPYASFQRLADAYLSESPKTMAPPTAPPTAPELVQLAFALDFTARVARLYRQNVGHITGLGFRYLQETFQYNQACTDHPWSDTDD